MTCTLNNRSALRITLLASVLSPLKARLSWHMRPIVVSQSGLKNTVQQRRCHCHQSFLTHRLKNCASSRMDAPTCASPNFLS